MSVSEDIAATLRAQEHGHQPVVCYPMENDSCGPRGLPPWDSQENQVWDATGERMNEHRTYRPDEPRSSALNPWDVQNKHIICIEGHTIDRKTGQNGCGWKLDNAYTLNATDRHGVIYRGYAIARFAEYMEGLPTLRASGGDNGGGVKR